MRRIRVLVLAVTIAFAGLSGSTGSTELQQQRARVSLDATERDAVGRAFSGALRDALGASERLVLANDGRAVDINITAISTPIECEGQTLAAVAIAAHRPGRARSSQWVNVVVTDDARVRDYARRVIADIAGALTGGER